MSGEPNTGEDQNSKAPRDAAVAADAGPKDVNTHVKVSADGETSGSNASRVENSNGSGARNGRGSGSRGRDGRAGGRNARGKGGQGRDGGGGRGEERGRGRGRDREDRGPRAHDRGGRDRGGKRGGGRRPDRKPDNSSPLTTGLFSAIEDREVECRVKGCKKTWTWFGSQQVRAFGEDPPQRMCESHLAMFHDLKDKEVPCRNAPGCSKHWVWKRGAQLHAIQSNQGNEEVALTPPSRLCSDCYDGERRVADQEIECKVAKCKRTWTWSRDAQLRHRAWLRRQQELEAAEGGEQAVDGTPATSTVGPVGEATAGGADLEQTGAVAKESQVNGVVPSDGSSDPSAIQSSEAESASDQEAMGKKGRKRAKSKRRRKAKLKDGPPEKMCKPCAQRFSKTSDIELPCKVHGCSGTWVWDRMGQLRAFAAVSGKAGEGHGAEPNIATPKRMCGRCRDFCRANEDRQVKCSNQDCERTWLYKTGAQLQAQLAGQREDPIRLCDSCIKQQYVQTGKALGLPEGAEHFPCVVPGCDGRWVYVPGMALQSVEEGQLAPDRMCDGCRVQRGHSPRDPAPEGADGASQSPASPASENESAASGDSVTTTGAEGAETDAGDSASGAGDEQPDDRPESDRGAVDESTDATPDSTSGDSGGDLGEGVRADGNGPSVGPSDQA